MSICTGWWTEVRVCEQPVYDHCVTGQWNDQWLNWRPLDCKFSALPVVHDATKLLVKDITVVTKVLVVCCAVAYVIMNNILCCLCRYVLKIWNSWTWSLTWLDHRLLTICHRHVRLHGYTFCAVQITSQTQQYCTASPVTVITKLSISCVRCSFSTL